MQYIFIVDFESGGHDEDKPVGERYGSMLELAVRLALIFLLELWVGLQLNQDLCSPQSTSMVLIMKSKMKYPTSKLNVTEKEFHLKMGEKFKKKYEHVIVKAHTIKVQKVVPFRLLLWSAK